MTVGTDKWFPFSSCPRNYAWSTLQNHGKDRHSYMQRSAYMFLATFLLATFPVLGQPEPNPLVQVHAHNDYEHPHPLFDALAQGFCSVEADIHLVNGHLLVA